MSFFTLPDSFSTVDVEEDRFDDADRGCALFGAGAFVAGVLGAGAVFFDARLFFAVALLAGALLEVVFALVFFGVFAIVFLRRY